VLFFCLICGASRAAAQSQASTGQISGSVRDSNGAAIPNATVRVTDTRTGVERTITTNDDGLYTVVLLPPSTYTVSAHAANFAEATASDVVVNVGRTTDVNLTLGVGTVQEAVTVTADSIQVTRSETDAVVNETAIDNLPINGRRFQDFVTLTPTAQVDPQRGQISLSGQRGINSNINVDGVDYNQPFFGGIRGGERSNAAFTIPQEAIQEFQVVPSGYSAEFGRSSGGVVNAVTKSGTNEIRGSAFYLIRPERMAAKNDFIRANERSRGVDIVPAPTQQQFGGSIGGPLRKDKAFYFFAFEQQLFSADRKVLFGSLNSLVTRSPANAEAFDFYRSLETDYEQTNNALAGLGRLDFQVNQNNRLSVRYNFSQNKALNANATGETTLNPIVNRALSNNGTERDRNNIGVIQLSTVFSPSVVNELRFQYAREDRPRPANALSPLVTASGVGNYGTVNFLPTTQYDKRIQVADSVNYIVGDHAIKIGGEFSNILANQIFGFNQFGVYNPGTGTADQQLQVLALTPGVSTDRRFDVTSASYLRQIGNLFAEYSVQEFSLFAQDSWRIRPNFTLNYGLRWEAQINPAPQANNEPLITLVRGVVFPNGRTFDPTFIPDQDDQFGPRLGFAWDPFSNGKTVIRAFSGLYYARTPLLLLAGPFNNFRLPPGDLSVRLPFALPANFNQAAFEAANPQYVAAGLRGLPPNTIYRQFRLIGIDLNTFSLGNLPNVTPAQIQQIASILNPTFNPTVTGLQPIAIAPDFKNPRSFQYGGAVEHEIRRGLTVGIDYAQVNTSHLQRNRDINFFPPVPSGPAQRPIYSSTRPVPQLGSVQVRESTARSLFQGLTFRTRINTRRMQLNAFYTLSRTLSDDDNERDAGGAVYDDSFNLATEYNYSRLDRRHQFVANPVVFLPFGFEVASAIRLRSGVPVNPGVNGDLNNNSVFSDRPYSAPGVSFKRNSFRNRPIYETDLRVQKGFNFDENRRLIFSAEFFNLFNAQNLQYSGSDVTQYCNTVNAACGLSGAPTNPNFLKIFDQNGNYILTNTLGSVNLVFQAQLGVRLQF
jgi:hypothetical protein